MTKAPAPPRHPDGALDLLRSLGQLNHAIEALSGDMHRRLGVTAQQRLVIRSIGKHQGPTAGELATFLHLDPGTVSATLGRLVRKGLVIRREDPLDRRRATLELTAQGRDLCRPRPGTVEHAIRCLLAGVEPRQLSATAAVLAQLTQHLRQELAPDGSAKPSARTKQPAPRRHR